MYPIFLGQPMYPGGLPVAPENCSFENNNAKELFALHVNDESSQLQDEMLKEYMIYYLGAPAFDSELTKWILSKKLDQMTILDLWEELMECGLDPF